MDDKLYERVSFENLLMSFFNQYYDLAQFAMTTGRIKTKDDYLEMQNTLENAATYSEDLISKIPKKEDTDFKEDTEEFLALIAKRLRNIKERYIHLQAKKFDGEQYSFFDDRAYIKNDRKYEKAISDLGIRMNKYKDETKRMLDL